MIVNALLRDLGKVVVMLALTLSAAASADIEIIGHVMCTKPAMSKYRANIPMRFYFAAGDTALDKTCYTDTSGWYYVRFKNLNSGNVYYVNAMGTSKQESPYQKSDFIHILLPQTWSGNGTYQYPGCDVCGEVGRGDTFEIYAGISSDLGISGYSIINVADFSPDSIAISGTITEKNDSTAGLDGVTVKATFRNYALAHDTVLTTTCDGGYFEFPAFFNDQCYTKVRLTLSKPGYPDLDTLMGFHEGIWSGITHKINPSLRMGTEGPKDPLDTIEITGTVSKKVSGSTVALPKAVAAISLAFLPDSTTFGRIFIDTTKSDGTYAIRFRDTTKSARVFYKVKITANNYATTSDYDKFYKIVVPDTAHRGGRLILENVSNINLDTLMARDSTDSIVVLGAIKDTSGAKISGASVKVYAGVDTSYGLTPTPLSVAVDTSGKYSVKIRNTSKSAHVSIKVQGSAGGYAANFLIKDTTGIMVGNAVNDTVRMADLVLHASSNAIIPDSIVVMGTIKDSSGTKILTGAYVRASFGPDTNNYLYPLHDTVQTDAGGKYSVSLPNTGNLSHVVLKVESITDGYKFNVLKTSATITAGDGKNDTIKIADLKLNGNNIYGDTLFVRGSIYDSISTAQPKRAVVGATVKIYISATFADLQSGTGFSISKTTDSSGLYEFKAPNTPLTARIFCKIQVMKSNYKDTSIIDTSNIFPGDWINDTIKVNSKLLTPIFTSYRGAIIPLVRFPVKIYDLSGRLIKYFVYESTGSTAGVSKYLKSTGMKQKTYIMEIDEKSGIIRKQIVNLK
jgi:hypothetical protein